MTYSRSEGAPLVAWLGSEPHLQLLVAQLATKVRQKSADEGRVRALNTADL
jgi:hypothetical protein